LAETSSVKRTTSPFSFGLENLPIIIVKGMVLQIEKYLKREVPQIFAAPSLFVQTMPIQSAGVRGRGNRIISRCRPK
jgi:hypothetical protein